MKKITYQCSKCFSDDILFDAWAVWNEDKQCFELHTQFDDAHCNQCGGSCDTITVEIWEEQS